MFGSTLFNKTISYTDIMIYKLKSLQYQILILTFLINELGSYVPG